MADIDIKQATGFLLVGAVVGAAVALHGGQRIDYGGQQVIGNHLGEIVVSDLRGGAFAGEDGLPNVNDRNERNQAEEGASEKIEAVSQVVLQPDIDDTPIFFHARRG